MPTPTDHTDVIIVSNPDDPVSLGLEASGADGNAPVVRVADSGAGATFTFSRQLTWIDLNGHQVDLRAMLQFTHTASLAATSHRSTPASMPQPAGVTGGTLVASRKHKTKQHNGQPAAVELWVSGAFDQSAMTVDVDARTLAFVLRHHGNDVASGQLTIPRNAWA